MADSHLQRPVYRCPCLKCQHQPFGETAREHKAINRVVAGLDERQRRLFAGVLALRRGRGGLVVVARITGLCRATIRRGLAELRSGVGPIEERIRKPGGGRPRIEKKRQWP